MTPYTFVNDRLLINRSNLPSNLLIVRFLYCCCNFVLILFHVCAPKGEILQPQFCLFVCVEVLRPSQQPRSCRADQSPINTVPGQA